MKEMLVQGPALYSYNDAEFNEDDWKGIRMLLQSVKQHDPHKVGCFGMGFKSVFHITGQIIHTVNGFGLVDMNKVKTIIFTPIW
jgi:hypothetical protein